MKLINGNILVLPESVGEEVVNGIILVSPPKSIYDYGKVVGISDYHIENGKKVAHQIKLNDRVMFLKQKYPEIKENGNTYYIMTETNIFGVFDE